MDCVLCQIADGMTDGSSRMRLFPDPIIPSDPVVGREYFGNAGMPQPEGREAGSLSRGPAPGSRGGGFTVGHSASVPVARSGGLWTSALKLFAPQHPPKSGPRSPVPIGPADYGRVTQNSNWRKTSVQIQWAIPGGPACTAENQPHGGAWLHIQRYLTIDDTRRPTLALAGHNMSSLDAPTLLEQAKERILRTLYPQKERRRGF